jgi:hypothetical protein
VKGEENNYNADDKEQIRDIKTNSNSDQNIVNKDAKEERQSYRMQMLRKQKIQKIEKMMQGGTVKTKKTKTVSRKT